MYVNGLQMLPTFHDDCLVSYEVNCETRQIKLGVRSPAWKLREDSIQIILFDGVEGYHFENDAFGNIISSLETATVEQLLSRYGSQMRESFRLAGALGPWTADLASAVQVLSGKGLQGFILESSMGLSGWVLAKEALVLPE